jgi:hypothetical protein
MDSHFLDVDFDFDVNVNVDFDFDVNVDFDFDFNVDFDFDFDKLNDYVNVSANNDELQVEYYYLIFLFLLGYYFNELMVKLQILFI